MKSDTTTRRSVLRHAAGAVICGLALSLAISPVFAHADAVSELQAVQQKISEANTAYSSANEKVEDLKGQIAENEERISQIEDQMPVLRNRASDSIRTLYKMQQGSSGILDLILSSDDFYDLITTIQYLDVIREHNFDAVDELAAAAEELQQTQSQIDSQMKDAEQERQNASSALDAANQARAELEEEIAKQAAAEEAARQAALEEAAREAAQGETFTTESGNVVPVEVPSANETPGTGTGSNSNSTGNSAGGSTGGSTSGSADAPSVDYQTDEESFVSEWSARIDAYLAGSPLAGQGTTFAKAAWAYGVDPRFSPAISAVESTKGLYCFKPYNAWGWGNSSWSNWEDAIWDHVAGLASGYGGQLTLAAAQKYCPPNADAWYASVLANMNRI